MTPQTAQTPLQELLRGVPKTQRLEIPMEGLTHGIHMIPVGVHCHAAADVIDGQERALRRLIRALQFIADECGQYSDGAPDASLHDKMCNFIEGIAKSALDLQKSDPVVAMLNGLQDLVRHGTERRGEAVVLMYDHQDGYFISTVDTGCQHHPVKDLNGKRCARLSEAIIEAIRWHNHDAKRPMRGHGCIKEPQPESVTEPDDDRLVTVCDKCLQASCWQGIFMCQDAQNAGTVEKTVRELKALGRENPSYWEKRAHETA